MSAAASAQIIHTGIFSRLPAGSITETAPSPCFENPPGDSQTITVQRMKRNPGYAWHPHSGYYGRLWLHPHVHCVVAACGLANDNTYWLRPRNPRFFLPKDVLSIVFRGKFIEGLQQAHASGQLRFNGLLRGWSQPT